jgi:predicted nucleic acid-binding protein
MNVYVESNFVIEYALEQDESDACVEIVKLASEERLKLIVPAFSLAEPHQAIDSKSKARARLAEDLRRHLVELGRSKPHRGIPATFEALAAALAASGQFEREGLRQSIKTILQTAEIIPLDAQTLVSSAVIEANYGLSGQDSIVLASVLVHLESRRPTASCFLNRNSRDFGDPEIRDRLEALSCKFFPRFDAGLAYISSRLG